MTEFRQVDPSELPEEARWILPPPPTHDAEGLSAEEWWAINEPSWRRNPDYFANLQAKAKQFGKPWVRKHKAGIDGHWKNMNQVLAFMAYLDAGGSLDDW